jgi:hypothetical protein
MLVQIYLPLCLLDAQIKPYRLQMRVQWPNEPF